MLCENGRYLAELLSERQKLGPFVQVLPHCSRLLNQGGFARSLSTLHFVVETSILISYADISGIKGIYQVVLEHQCKQ